MNGKGPMSSAWSPEVLALRWQESREYFPRNARNRETWPRAVWLHPSAHGSLELRWYQSKPANR